MGRQLPERVDVAVVGGGPVGLFLGGCLLRRGVSCAVLERRAEPMVRPQAIGIHPVGLELFDREGLAGRMVAAGLPVRRGAAFSTGGRRIGALRFDRVRSPFRFILSLPQPEMEAILEDGLAELDHGCLRRGVEVVGVDPRSDGCGLVARLEDGATLELEAGFAVGCDGKHSTVRRSVGIRFEGGAYPDSYAMGDLADPGDLGDEAAIFLHRDGVVESLPMPGGVRRWVCRVPREAARTEQPRALLDREVLRRTGVDVSGAAAVSVTTFTAERFLAERCADGRIALAGDAAHVTSPIGGQGLNLGWRDAWAMAELLCRSAGRAGGDDALRSYDRWCRRSARLARRRAELYMWLGRPRRWTWPRDGALALLLRSPASRVLARVFAMGGFPAPPA